MHYYLNCSYFQLLGVVEEVPLRIHPSWLMVVVHQIHFLTIPNVPEAVTFRVVHATNHLMNFLMEVVALNYHRL